MGEWQVSQSVAVLSGSGDIRGCGCELHSGGVGMAEACSEEPVPEGDAGELQEPGVTR